VIKPFFARLPSIGSLVCFFCSSQHQPAAKDSAHGSFFAAIDPSANQLKPAALPIENSIELCV